MPIRLIALDLDDTLLRHDLSISAGDKQACRNAMKAGASIVLASGRNIHSMEKYARDLGIEGEAAFIISTNGAEIVELGTRELIFERRIPPGLCREAAAELDKRGFPFQIYAEGRILVSRRNKWTDEDTRLTGQPNELLADREPRFAAGQLKFVVPGDPEDIALLYREFSGLFAGRLRVLISKPYFMEILSEGVDKGDALRRLAERLRIGRDEVLAAGDAMNDIGMVEWAGAGCAPANAIPEVKAVARYVSPYGNDEGAVADIIGRMVLA